MSDRLYREYLLRLPLPIAQLYLRAHNAKDARARHDHGFYVLEAATKLSAVSLLARALQTETGSSGQDASQDKWNRQLAALARPSLGHWAALCRYLATTHPIDCDLTAALQRRLDAKVAPALLELYRRMSSGPDQRPSTAVRFRLLDLIDALVAYRNAVMGHGGPRTAEFYESRMGPLLFPALNEALAPGIWPTLGQEDARLIHLGELRVIEPGVVEASSRELTGLQGERRDPARLPQALLEAWYARGAGAPAIALRDPEGPPIPVGPMLRFRESELADEVLIHNARKGAADLEQLSYATGRIHKELGAAPALALYLGLQPAQDDTPPSPAIPGASTFGSAAIDDSDQPTSAALPPSSQATPQAAGPSVMAPGAEIGDYRLIAELGKGGMGVVFLAEQRTLGRLVAFKTLFEAQAQEPEVLARFSREVQVLGRCDHPNIAKLLDHGESRGARYYTMEYVPGADLERIWKRLAKQAQRRQPPDLDAALDEACREARKKLEAALSASPHDPPEPDTAEPSTVGTASAALQDALTTLTPSRRDDPDPTLAEVPVSYAKRVCRLIAEACEALDLLHERNVVHRDVSPANLMLNPDGRRLVVMDFGLARPGAGQADVTRPGGFVGKYRYAAPEQLAGQEVGPAADVRGIGVTLWEMLTRRRLFGEAEDVRSLTAMVHERDVPRLRSLEPELDRDLEAIVAQAVHRDEARRTPNAGELARHLRLYLEGRPLPIRQASLRELTARWASEHRSLVAGAVAAGVLAAGLISFSFLQIEKARQQAQRNAEVARQVATDTFALVNESPLFRASLMTPGRRDLLVGLIDRYRQLPLGEEPADASQAARFRLLLAAAQTQIGDFDSAARTLADAQQTIARVRRAEERPALEAERRIAEQALRLAASNSQGAAEALGAFEDAQYGPEPPGAPQRSGPLPLPGQLLGGQTGVDPASPEWRLAARTEHALGSLHRMLSQHEAQREHLNNAALLFELRLGALAQDDESSDRTEAHTDWAAAALDLGQAYEQRGLYGLSLEQAQAVRNRLDGTSIDPENTGTLPRGPLVRLYLAQALARQADLSSSNPDLDFGARIDLTQRAFDLAVQLRDDAPTDARPTRLVLRSAATLARLCGEQLGDWRTTPYEHGATQPAASDPESVPELDPAPPTFDEVRALYEQGVLAARLAHSIHDKPADRPIDRRLLELDLASARATLERQYGQWLGAAGTNVANAPDAEEQSIARLADAVDQFEAVARQAATLHQQAPERVDALRLLAEAERAYAFARFLRDGAVSGPNTARAAAQSPYRQAAALAQQLVEREPEPTVRAAMLYAHAHYDLALVHDPGAEPSQLALLERAVAALDPFAQPLDWMDVAGLFHLRAEVYSGLAIARCHANDPVGGLRAMAEAERAIAGIREYGSPALAAQLALELDVLAYMTPDDPRGFLYALRRAYLATKDTQNPDAVLAALRGLQAFTVLRQGPAALDTILDPDPLPQAE